MVNILVMVMVLWTTMDRVIARALGDLYPAVKAVPRASFPVTRIGWDLQVGSIHVAPEGGDPARPVRW